MEQVTVVDRKKRLYRVTIIAILILTIASTSSYYQETQKLHSNTLKLATNTARSNFEKDLAFREWVAEHGGIYVPENERTPQNPYLEHVEEQNIQTSSGINLTLMNPAYALRQLIEEYETRMGIIGHITSLDPLNPENTADEWETIALEAFERGAEEISELSEIDGVVYLRLMKPMFTQESCLKCHSYQGYSLGDIRGGISIAVPMTEYLLDESEVQRLNITNHGLLWSLGLVGIILGTRQISGDIDEAIKAEQTEAQNLRLKILDEEKHNNNLATLQEHVLQLSFTTSVEDVAEVTLNIMFLQLGFQYSSFLILDNKNLRMVKYLYVTQSSSVNPFAIGLLPLSGKGVTVKAAREARTILLNDVSKDPDYLDGSLNTLSELVVPIIFEGRVLGVLNVESLDLNAFSVNDVQLVEVLAQNVGVTLTRLEALENQKELERQILIQQVQVEQEQELGRLKTRFISTATHELRTPVTSILGYLELIQEDLDQDNMVDIKEDLRVVFRNAQRLVTLTNDLLDVQRITSGKFEVQREHIDVVKTLNDVTEELTPLFLEKKQTLQVKAPPELIVDVDETRISQLFINLLRNANKFTPDEGTISVSIEHNETQVTIVVEDEGIGLSEEEIGKLFKPFPGIQHRLEVNSTGLGLAISKGIVDMHNGEIWAESDGHGKGSKFFVKIPF